MGNPNPVHKLGQGNPGRPKGSLNKTTSLKILIAEVFAENREKAHVLLTEMFDTKTDFKWLCGLVASFEARIKETDNNKGDTYIFANIDTKGKPFADRVSTLNAALSAQFREE